MTLRPSTAPKCVPLPSPPASSLPDGPDPESDSLRAASPTVTRFLANVVTAPLFESTVVSALVAELVDFVAACRLDYAASLVAEPESASVCPPSVRGECALGTEVLEDRQEEFECFAAALPHLVPMLLALEGDPDAPDIPTPRSYVEAIEGTYVDEVPPLGANIISGMWIFRVKRSPGSPPVFKARYIARGFSQRQGVDFFHTFSPTPKMTTLRVLLHVAARRDYELHSLDFSTAFLQGSLHEEIWLRCPLGFTGPFPAGTQWSLRRPVYGLRQAPREWHNTPRTTLGFAPSTADPSLFLRTDTTLPPFYVLVAQPTITLTRSYMVQQVLQHFGFTYSSPQSTPLPTSHSLSAPPSDESVEPSGPYPELVGCLMYLMTCTRPDLAYPLSILARYVAPGKHRTEHMDAAKRVLRYLCSTSGMGLVLGGRARVVLTGHVDASWVADLATQWSSQGYTFSLGSGSVSWRSTRSSSVLSFSCEADIYVGAMAAQELCWLTYPLTDLGEAPRSPPVLYVDNKAMLALCQEHRLEHRMKHIALCYFLARELQQRGQLRLAYVATQANTVDIFTKALQPCDHQRFCTMLGYGEDSLRSVAAARTHHGLVASHRHEADGLRDSTDTRRTNQTLGAVVFCRGAPISHVGHVVRSERIDRCIGGLKHDIAQEIQLRGVTDFQEILAMAEKLDFFHRPRLGSYGSNSNWGHRSRGTNEGTMIRAFDTWLGDLQLYLLSDSRDSVPLFDHTSGAAPAPPTTVDNATRSQWLTRDTAARLAIRNHLPLAECAHFGQHRTAQALYDADVARYSLPATAALGHLLLPYLFPELSAFATVEDLVSHLCTSDAHYRAALPAEFLEKNPPPMYITLYFIVTHLPDSLHADRDHFLALDPTALTVDLLEQHLLAAETSVVAVGAARGTLGTPFLRGALPPPLPPPTPLLLLSTSLVLRTSGLLLLVQSAAAARARVAGVVAVAAGVVVGAAVEVVEAVEVVAAVGVVAGVGAMVAAVEAAVGVVTVGLELSLERGASGGSVSCPYVIRTGDRANQTCRKPHTQHHCFSRLDDAWRAEFGDEAERPRWAELLRYGVAIFDLDYDAILAAMYALSVSAEGDCYLCVPPDPGIEATTLGASESVLPGTALAQTLHTFTLDSGASCCFFRDSTTLTPLSALISVRLADPSGGSVLARSSTVLPCPAVPSGSLSGLHLPSFSTNLVSTAALQNAMVTTTTHGGQHVSVYTCTRTGRHLATFTRRPGSSLYTLAIEPPQVAASAQVSASGQSPLSATPSWHALLPPSL
ncbi:unnamed protein product [Closterium sp. NIES-54]